MPDAADACATTFAEPADPRAPFAESAHAFAELVGRIPADAWAGPGLGEWDLRALVGHTSRSLTTVLIYLPKVTQIEVVPTTVSYYVAAAQLMAADPAAVTERGRQAGVALGADPARFVRGLVRDCLAALDAVDDDPIIESIVGGMRLSRYLVTRTFELVVHGLDIATATGLTFEPPAPALADSLRLAVDIAIARQDGPRLLLMLTGRQGLPERFSVV